MGGKPHQRYSTPRYSSPHARPQQGGKPHQRHSALRWSSPHPHARPDAERRLPPIITHTHMHACTGECRQTCTCILLTCMHTHAHAHTHIHANARTHACIHSHSHIVPVDLCRCKGQCRPRSIGHRPRGRLPCLDGNADFCPLSLGTRSWFNRALTMPFTQSYVMVTNF